MPTFQSASITNPKGTYPGHGSTGVEVVVWSGSAVAVGIEPIQIHTLAQLESYVHRHDACARNQGLTK
eukprot:5419816-Pyramimonas_sp.AAC.2